MLKIPHRRIGRIALATAGFVLLTACNPNGDVTSNAPACDAIDPLLLKLTELQGADDFIPKVNQALSAVPQESVEASLERLRAARVALDQKNGAQLGEPSIAVALLHGSTKQETRTSGAFRYCKGNFPIGNGQSVAWSFSMTSEGGLPVFRLLSAEIDGVAGDLATETPEPSSEEMQPSPSFDSADSETETRAAVDEPDDIATPRADHNPADNPDSSAMEQSPSEDHASEAEKQLQVERERLELERQQLALERERQQLALERDRQEAERREAKEIARIEAERQAAREEAAREAEALAAAAAARPTIDEVFERRRDECPRGFLGSACRDELRRELCSGRWSANPPAGESQCKQ